jgi:hypothetical protein
VTLCRMTLTMRGTNTSVQNAFPTLKSAEWESWIGFVVRGRCVRLLSRAVGYNVSRIAGKFGKVFGRDTVVKPTDQDAGEDENESKVIRGTSAVSFDLKSPTAASSTTLSPTSGRQ